MPAQKLSIDINIDSSGKPSVAGVRGGGGGGAGAATASAARRQNDADAYQLQRIEELQRSRSITNPGSVYGGAASRSLDALTNPFLSGGEQKARLEIEAARSVAYMAGGGSQSKALLGEAHIAGSNPLTAGNAPPLIESARQAEQMGRIVGDAAAAALEKSLAKQIQVSSQANQTVGGISAQYASAGVKLSDQQIDNMLKMETARQSRIYEANSRVAARSGNFTANSVQDVQSGMQDGLDSSRLQADSIKLGHKLVGSAGIHMAR